MCYEHNQMELLQTAQKGMNAFWTAGFFFSLNIPDHYRLYMHAFQHKAFFFYLTIIFFVNFYCPGLC